MSDDQEWQPTAKRPRLGSFSENGPRIDHTDTSKSQNLTAETSSQVQVDTPLLGLDCQMQDDCTTTYANDGLNNSSPLQTISPASEFPQYAVPLGEQLPSKRSPEENLPLCQISIPSDDAFASFFDSALFEEDGDSGSEVGETKVCFGVITGLAGTYERQASQDLPASFEVQLDSASRFTSKNYSFIRGRVHTEHAQLLQGVTDEKTLDLYVTCTADARPVAKKRGRTHMLWPCTLDITVYGPFDLFDELGNWFQDYEVHLQDPRVCHLDTKYCNPQRLSSVRPWPLVSEIVSQRLFPTPKEIPERSDFLDILSSHVDLEETPQPLTIRTSLKSHQKQALTFMLDRERGWGFNRGHADIWEIVDTGSGRVFLNTISRLCQPEEPLNFFGGIIADPMGFGKTLTMISLVATDKDAGEMTDICMEGSETRKPDIAATLVIIPPPLIGTWEEQLQDRILDTDEIGLVHIVLTTYHTVSSDWKADQETGHSPIFAVRWKRIILDEAHFIRNGNARMARAVCDLEATSRWAVTGTPIQNRLGDLASLLKFVRAYPYTDPKQFDADISRPWKSGEDEEAVKRLKRLSACLLLRRPKGALDLPPRRDLVYKVEFMPEEKEAIVFSTWRLTLDLITRGLEDERIRSIRFDGKVPQKDRQSVLGLFNSDPGLRVMLLTLSCGAVGLTLTAASRAYLMEPHWNPTLEEQALARIHRLGQSREVETVRFYVQDSFEEQVMKIQESKKQLAGVLLSSHDRESSNDNLGTLEVHPPLIPR
ncbi:hypothetical protein NUW58_g4138 [Xylaria curta]|uniref:Uncharacterized protein n=1 Tax=Xylaria curta TaxID=42375 RepID=A0ACC1PAA3_9PEZI|nr:hypothetical protein NUW58_g4138 [Xylaria curta]